MVKNEWKAVILTQLEQLGLQNDAYDSSIDALAAILEQRDRTFDEFRSSGGQSCISYTNKTGHTNLTKNPLLVLWDEQNKTALAYWRELGMTPSSYKKITGEGASKTPEKKGLAAALAEIKV